MPEQNLNMVPAAVIARDICTNFGDTTRKHFGEHLVNIIDAFKFLHIFMRHVVEVKSIILPNSNLVELPCGFIKETKVGIINDQGRIACMSIDKTLRQPAQSATMKEVEAAVTEAFSENIGLDGFSVPFYNCYDGGGILLGEQYGYAQSINTLGYFNIDRKENLLLVSPSVPENTSIVMEYITDGVSDGLQLIPSELATCVKNKAKAQFCKDKKDPRFSVYEADYVLDYKNAKRLYNAKPIDYYAEIFKQQHRYAPK
jgi:hypothetical protein